MARFENFWKVPQLVTCELKPGGRNRCSSIVLSTDCAIPCTESWRCRKARLSGASCHPSRRSQRYKHRTTQASSLLISTKGQEVNKRAGSRCQGQELCPTIKCHSLQEIQISNHISHVTELPLKPFLIRVDLTILFFFCKIGRETD